MKTIVIDQPIGYYNSDGQWLRQKLAEAKGEDIRVEISSPGGFVFDGLEMFNLLKNYEGNVTTHIMGLAASMASYLALAGKRITAEANAVFMIHNVWGVVVGDYSDMQDAANTFKGLSSLLGKTYAARTGKSEKDIKALMDAETYYFGDEMKDAGFVDEIIPTEKKETRDDAVAYARLALEECVSKMKAEKSKPDDLKKAAALLRPVASGKPAQHPASSSAGNNTKEVSAMTLEELKAQHPALYQEVFTQGKNAGMDEMHASIMAHMEWIEADPKGVVAAITAREPFSMKNLSAYNKAAMKVQAVQDRTDDNPPDVKTKTTTEPEAYEKELDAALEARFGLKPEVK